jgi:hypothetical protein
MGCGNVEQGKIDTFNMILNERITAIMVCVFGTVMLTVLGLYGWTFFAWNASSAFLVHVNSVLETLSWLVLATCMVAGVVIGIIKRNFRWSTRYAPPLIQKLYAWAFVITFVLLVVTSMKYKRVEVRAQGHTGEISVKGNWETVPVSVLEQTVRQNARSYLVFVLAGFFMWMGLVVGVTTHRKISCYYD